MKNNHMKKIVITVALAFSGALSVSTAMAQVDNNVSVNSGVSVKHLQNIGEPTGNLESLKGFAKDLPLLTVLRQITPNGWLVKKNDNASNKLNVQQSVSWNGGNSWVDTLEVMANQYNFNVIVNWDSKEITLSPMPIIVKEKNKPVEVSKNGLFELEGSETTPVTTGNSQADVKENKVSVEPIKAVVVAPVVVAPVVVAPIKLISWNLIQTLSLKENVEAWGKSVGYHVVWNGDDYPVDATRELTGDFESNNGPIKQLSVDYGPKSRVKQPLAFQFFQNNTLVVDNLKYEQQGFPQYK
jgi:hypothetical protein